MHFVRPSFAVMLVKWELVCLHMPFTMKAHLARLGVWFFTPDVRKFDQTFFFLHRKAHRFCAAPARRVRVSRTNSVPSGTKKKKVWSNLRCFAVDHARAVRELSFQNNGSKFRFVHKLATHVNGHAVRPLSSFSFVCFIALQSHLESTRCHVSHGLVDEFCSR